MRWLAPLGMVAFDAMVPPAQPELIVLGLGACLAARFLPGLGSIETLRGTLKPWSSGAAVRAGAIMMFGLVAINVAKAWLQSTGFGSETADRIACDVGVPLQAYILSVMCDARPPEDRMRGGAPAKKIRELVERMRAVHGKPRTVRA